MSSFSEVYPIVQPSPSRYKRCAPESMGTLMPNINKPLKEFYSETEAAEALNMSITRLRMLLDEHVFNDGSSRPEELKFRNSDLVLLKFWDRSTANPKVLRMPNRV